MEAWLGHKDGVETVTRKVLKIRDTTNHKT